MQIGLIIPQLFYDCIARIVPGTVMLLTVFIIWGKGLFASFLDYLNGRTFIAALLYLMVVYLISFLIEGFLNIRWIDSDSSIVESPRKIQSWLSNLWNKIRGYYDYAEPDLMSICDEPSLIKRNIKRDIWIKALCRIKKNHRIPKIIESKLKWDRPICEYMAYDFIRMENPEAGSRIVKLKAEKNLCENLGFGWFLIYTLYTFQILFHIYQGTPSPQSLTRPVPTLVSLFVIIVFINARKSNLYILFLRSIYNHWLLLQCDTVSNNSSLKTDKDDDSKKNAA